MIKNINILEVNEFIKVFHTFAENNFKYFKKNNNSNDGYQDFMTGKIRNSFLNTIKFVLNNLNLEKSSPKGLRRSQIFGDKRKNIF